MGQEIDGYSMEARHQRVLRALNVLMGKEPPLITAEESAILANYREVCAFGWGRVEVVVVAHRMEGINSTLHKKRKDLIQTP